MLKDDPEYVAFQLGVVGATEVSRVLKLGDDGFVTQTIVNRPNVVVPRIVRPLLRGSAIEFKDVRRFRDGTQRTVPFVAELSVSNSISDRVDQRGVITVRNVVVDDTGALRPAPPPPRDGEGEIDLSTPDLCASRVATGAVGGRVCEIECVGEVTCRVGPFSGSGGGGGAQHARRVRSVPEDHGGVERRAQARAREGTDGKTSTARSAAEVSSRTPGGEDGRGERPRRRGGGDGGRGRGRGDVARDAVVARVSSREGSHGVVARQGESRAGMGPRNAAGKRRVEAARGATTSRAPTTSTSSENEDGDGPGGSGLARETTRASVTARRVLSWYDSARHVSTRDGSRRFASGPGVVGVAGSHCLFRSRVGEHGVQKGSLRELSVSRTRISRARKSRSKGGVSG